MEQLTKNQAVATSQDAVQNQNEPQLRHENAHNDKSVHGVLHPTYQAGLRRDAVQPDIEAELLLAFSRRLHARIRKTRYMHKMRCLLINRRSLLLALRLLWKTPIFPSNSRFPRLCAKCLLKLKRLVSILPMTKSKK